MKQRREQILTRFMELLHTDNVMWANEVRANALVSLTMLVCAALLFVVWCLNQVGIFKLEIEFFNQIILGSAINLLIPFFICMYYKGQRKWLKFVMLMVLIFVFSCIDAILTHRVVMLMVVPVVLSTCYYSKKLTVSISIYTGIVFLFSSVVGAYYGILNINDVVMEPGRQIITEGGLLFTTIRNAGFDYSIYLNSMLVNSYLPKFMIFIVISLACIEIAERSRELVYKQAELTQASVAIDTELKTAAKIQSDMLPNDFPEEASFELYANMAPAKAVGGDFYDFFMLDENHLVVVIADVSDKGIPASLFMAITKTLIKSNVQEKNPVNEIFNKVNKLLCEVNQSDFFVTAWLGIINLQSGKVEYVNAGHNNPIVGHNGIYKEIPQKHGFVLAAMEETSYIKQELRLDKDDVLFLYTDGMTDANNKDKDLFGVERLIHALAKANQNTMKDLSLDVKKEISKFTNGQEQFDDMTLLAIKYKGNEIVVEIELDANLESCEQLIDFVNERLESYNCPQKVMYQIDVAIDELFTNIASYAYETDIIGKVQIRFMKIDDPLAIEIEFRDTGKPFNPLENEDPDITKDVEERQIGGLGIFIVKKTMDEVKYEYKNGQNIIQIKKVL